MGCRLNFGVRHSAVLEFFVAVISGSDNLCFQFGKHHMLSVEKINEVAMALKLGNGLEFLADADRQPVTDFNVSVSENASAIQRELEKTCVTLEQASGMTFSKIQKQRDDGHSRLLTLLQQRVKLAESRRSIIGGFVGGPQAAEEAARAAFNKAWKAAETSLRKAGVSDAIESVFKVSVRATVPVREAQATLDAASAACRSFSALLGATESAAGEVAANDLIEFVREQVS